MDTTQIILEEVTVDQFDQLQRFWGKKMRLYTGDIYSQIRNPIIETDYEHLLFSLLDHPLSDLLCVNDHGVWIKQKTSTLTDAQVRDLAKIAAHDPLKRNYLEIKFARSGGWFKTARIEFIEYQGKIIGYDMEVAKVIQHAFTVKTNTPSYNYNQGLWVPK